jgi:hypothetical protein
MVEEKFDLEFDNDDLFYRYANPIFKKVIDGRVMKSTSFFKPNSKDNAASINLARKTEPPFNPKYKFKLPNDDGKMGGVLKITYSNILSTGQDVQYMRKDDNEAHCVIPFPLPDDFLSMSKKKKFWTGTAEKLIKVAEWEIEIPVN